jgi:hypothetical protein
MKRKTRKNENREREFVHRSLDISVDTEMDKKIWKLESI